MCDACQHDDARLMLAVAIRPQGGCPGLYMCCIVVAVGCVVAPDTVLQEVCFQDRSSLCVAARLAEW